MGRDLICKAGFIPYGVSTHAPAWGATQTATSNNGTKPSFNPRARMGRDRIWRANSKRGQVSTHAPAWGATFPRSRLAQNNKFQPTRPHGARLTPAKALDEASWFQPTRPHGARLSPRSNARTFCLFQPTRPHGARPAMIEGARRMWRVSTHAPAWGATARLPHLRRPG